MMQFFFKMMQSMNFGGMMMNNMGGQFNPMMNMNGNSNRYKKYVCFFQLK